MTVHLENTIIQKLKEKEHSLCTVESCTGGLLAHLLTNVSGASEVYWGSHIVYDNSAKEALGVPFSLIKNFGAVSNEVAKSLAESGLHHLQKTLEEKKSSSLLHQKKLLCIATTGIAGPTGGSDEKPVGLCYIALEKTDTETVVRRIEILENKTRLDMKLAFAHEALELIRGLL